MSTAMMSAPSLASRTACARPWPRAAPVTRATLPFNVPITYHLDSEGDRLAGKILWAAPPEITCYGTKLREGYLLCA